MGVSGDRIEGRPVPIGVNAGNSARSGIRICAAAAVGSAIVTIITRIRRTCVQSLYLIVCPIFTSGPSYFNVINAMSDSLAVRM